MSLLEIKNIKHSYGPKKVLDNVTINVDKGEIVGILGVNGAGKSTIFKILTGACAVQQGEVRFLDAFAAGSGQIINQTMRSHSGVVFQSSSLDQKLSVLDNLSLATRLYGMKNEDVHDTIQNALSLSGLEPRKHEQVKKLSGGLKRRLELARALMHNPQLLLLDEPAAGLDHNAFGDFWGALNSIRKKSEMGTFLVTHNVEEAELCDRLLILANGKIVSEGTPDELKKMVADDTIVLNINPRMSHRNEEHLSVLKKNFNQLNFNVHYAEIITTAQHAHELIPQLVHALPKDSIASVFVRKPSLRDAFSLITGGSQC